MSDVTCLRCGSVNDFRTVESGPHIKAICNGCDKYIKFISRAELPPCCPECGEVGSLKTEQYGCFHTITKCSNCNHSIINNTNKTLSDVKPDSNNMEQQQSWAPAQPATTAPQEQTFAPGIRMFDKHPNAPSFVLASMIITPKELYEFVTANPQVLTEYNGQKQLKLQIKRSQQGAIYAAIDTFKPQAQAPAPAQSGWGAPPQAQAPASNGWGQPAPPANYSAAGAAPPDDLPF